MTHALERIDYKPWISGAAQPKLTKDRLRSIFFSVPTPEEQELIVKYINTETKDLVAAISRAEREIELIREYQTRLIADVVTGKVDVRDVPVDSITDDELSDEEFSETEDLEELQEAFNADS